MLGYSDSGKDAGRVAAAWALYGCQEQLVEASGSTALHACPLLQASYAWQSLPHGSVPSALLLSGSTQQGSSKRGRGEEHWLWSVKQSAAADAAEGSSVPPCRSVRSLTSL